MYVYASWGLLKRLYKYITTNSSKAN